MRFGLLGALLLALTMSVSAAEDDEVHNRTQELFDLISVQALNLIEIYEGDLTHEQKVSGIKDSVIAELDPALEDFLMTAVDNAPAYERYSPCATAGLFLRYYAVAWHHFLSGRAVTSKEQVTRAGLLFADAHKNCELMLYVD